MLYWKAIDRNCYLYLAKDRNLFYQTWTCGLFLANTSDRLQLDEKYFRSCKVFSGIITVEEIYFLLTDVINIIRAKFGHKMSLNLAKKKCDMFVSLSNP